MNIWFEWIQETSLSDWLMVFTSVASVYVAWVALRISKRAHYAEMRSDVLPIKVDLRDAVHLKNNGPGMAYDIKVYIPFASDPVTIPHLN